MLFEPLVESLVSPEVLRRFYCCKLGQVTLGSGQIGSGLPRWEVVTACRTQT